jgi:F-type H+-transporting ATPase subunit gamma
MLLRASRIPARAAGLVISRGFATEKQLAMSIASTKNIMKITSSMKMVSAAKLKGDENRLYAARPFNKWSNCLSSPPVLLEDSDFSDIPDNSLIVPLTSDKGLCGGVNSFISRGVRSICGSLDAAGKKSSVVVVGDKGRSQMRRMVGEKMVSAATEVQTPGNFDLASAIASEVMSAGDDYAAIVIVHNKFINSAVYHQHYKVLTPLSSTPGENESLPAYEFEPDIKNEVLEDLHEYHLTSQIFHSFMEAAASEQSARMAAMENATKNAGEMVDKLTLQYNRARQARITTELIEIISGASAIEG